MYTKLYGTKEPLGTRGVPYHTVLDNTGININMTKKKCHITISMI